jgi:hypothetical protein
LFPRDIAVGGQRIAAISGFGYLWIATLGSNAPPLRLVAPGVLFAHPALSADGTRLVAEGFPFVTFGPDTIPSPVGDLWLFELP